MNAAELLPGDIVKKPNGFMDWPKWEHFVSRFNGDTVYTLFSNGGTPGPDWMSLTNMDSCLAQPDTIVIREGKQIHPETIMTNEELDIMETIMTNEELDIMEETYADIPPMNWRNYGTWFGGAMVKPTTSESLEYCVENGTYFDAPNAYFIEGWEDGDCEATVIGTGEVPPLGDLPQYTLTEIWDEMFTNPNVTEIPQELEAAGQEVMF